MFGNKLHATCGDSLASLAGVGLRALLTTTQILKSPVLQVTGFQKGIKLKSQIEVSNQFC